MKKIFTLLSFLLTLAYVSNATTYYVSSSQGNDGNNGTSSSSPWQSLSKINSFTKFAPGDNILFNRGDVFYGKIVVNQSGNAGNPITYGAYRSGANPVISGFTSVISWTNLGGNIWESSSAVSSLSTCNMVVINGVNTAMGRYPNSGYLTYQSFSGNSSITSSSLTGSPDSTGAEVVIRKQRFIIDRNFITSQSGPTIYYNSASSYAGQSGYGFFIQNDPRTLDQQNEWYYNPSTQKIRIYSTNIPSNVQLTTVDTLVNISFKGNITFSNLAFQGSNQDAFTILSSPNITITNCSIDYSGKDAIWGAKNGGGSSDSFIFQSSTINHTNNNSITLKSEFTNALVSNNTIKNTGLNAGLGGNGSSNYGTLQGVQVLAINSTIKYNVIDSVGFNVIYTNQSNVLIANNLITNFCTVKLDGGGVYSYIGTGTTTTGLQVLNNIILNGIGNGDGTNAPSNVIAHGIYLDGGTTGAVITGNTTANCAHSGLYVHDSYNLNIQNNTSYNNGIDQVLFASDNQQTPIRNVTFQNNILVAKSVPQATGSFQSAVNDIGSFGAIDYNIYARPVSDSLSMAYCINEYTTCGQLSFAQWQQFANLDAHSKTSPRSIPDTSYLLFKYNATSSSVTIPLNSTYIDMKNVTYNGSITLAPFTSAVLLRTGSITNSAPVANAGTNQTITLPVNAVTLSGSGTDASGTITSYNWSLISGPSAPSLTNANTTLPSVSGLSVGTYVFQLTVSDNNGASGSAQVTVNVQPATTISTPVANAGPDQTITAPASSVTLSGSGTDVNGTITLYNWSLISGPNAPSINGSGNASTSASGLVAGTYVFQLTVSDNNGSSATDQMIVNVLPANSISTPAANAVQPNNKLSDKLRNALRKRYRCQWNDNLIQLVFDKRPKCAVNKWFG